MTLVTYPCRESDQQRKAREKLCLPQPTFSFTVRGTDASDRDSQGAVRAIESMRDMLKREAG